MDTSISRRRVVAGSAWTVPAVVVAAAAPAMAASGPCPRLLSTTSTTGNGFATVRLNFSAIAGGQFPLLSARVTSLPAGLNASTPDPVALLPGPKPLAEVLILFSKANGSGPRTGDVTITYTVTGLANDACTYAPVTFAYP